jgi:hypothetical protein
MGRIKSSQRRTIKKAHNKRQFSPKAAIFPTIHAFSRQTEFWSGPVLSFTEFREILFFALDVMARATKLRS